MEELLLVNPRKRRKGRKVAKRKTTHRRRASVPAIVAAPRRRYRRNPIAKRVSRRRYKRNPIGGRLDFKGTIMPALEGAAGGLALDFLMGLSIVPAALKTGQMANVTKVVGALALGMVAKNFVGSGTAANMVRGAMVVTLHDALKVIATGAGVKLNGVGYYPVQNLHGVGAYAPQGQPAIPDISAGFSENGYGF
jgi:hypothetical protein